MGILERENLSGYIEIVDELGLEWDN